jgi:DNA-binding GntR family transcriptional regulator
MNRPDLSISRNYLHDQVVQQLRALILSGDLEPKAKLNEAALAERFGISRTPLREAIKVLSAEGLLELLPNRGARVASLSHAEIDEMLDVVAALEMTAGELACRHATEDQIVALRSIRRSSPRRATACCRGSTRRCRAASSARAIAPTRPRSSGPRRWTTTTA